MQVTTIRPYGCGPFLAPRAGARVLGRCLLLATLLVAAACADLGDSVDVPPGFGPDTESDLINAGTATVVIKDLQFDPKEITVAAGTTVMWVMEDTGTFHFVAEGSPNAGEGEFKSPQLNVGESWEYTFTEPGEYVYHCSNHSVAMRNAKVIVE